MKERFVSFNDKNFKYTGVWQIRNDKYIESCHTSAQMEFGFTGSVIKISADAVNLNFIKFILDGNITNTVLENGFIVFKAEEGSHTLKIISQCHAKFLFKGIYLSEYSKIFRTEDKKYIQFIGDSITDAYPGFSTRVAENLEVDYSIVSLCGISLVDKWGWYAIPEGAPHRYGMESTYFCLQNPKEKAKPEPYDFEVCRVPDAFVIFLGTNDYISSEQDKSKGNFEIFAQRYIYFITKLRERFGEKPIFILNAHRQSVPLAIECTTNALNQIAEKFSNIHLFDCYNWDIELLPDGVHPSDNGYLLMTEKISEYIKNQEF